MTESRGRIPRPQEPASPAVLAMALAGAVLMPVSLFPDWYGIREQAGRDFDAYTLDGWDVFEATDTLMVLVALATLALVVLRPRHASRALLLLGALTTGWIVVQLLDRPAVLGFLDRSDMSLEVGAWIGLLGAVLIASAGMLGSARRDRPGD